MMRRPPFETFRRLRPVLLAALVLWVIVLGPLFWTHAARARSVLPTLDGWALAPDTESSARAAGTGGRPPRLALIDPALRSLLQAGSRQPLPVIIQLIPPDSAGPPRQGGGRRASLDEQQLAFSRRAQPLLQWLTSEQQARRVSSLKPLWIANAVAATLEPQLLAELAARPDVRLVVLDRSLPLEAWHPAGSSAGPLPAAGNVQWNVRAVRADDVWRVFGIDGQGMTVAILDTGVDGHHPSLRTRYRGYASQGFLNLGNWWCDREDPLCGFGGLYPVDSIGHGTHVAGTAVGGEGIGVAPGARWIAARVCGDATCQLSWIIGGLQWLLAPGGREDMRPDVVNISLGNDDSDGSLVLKDSIDALTAAGVIVVASAGNRSGMVTEPAVYPNVIAVGAVDQSLRRWPLSGYGQTPWQESKPDLMAPGVAITSAVPGGGFGLKIGTSMAAPHVSGVIALLKQAKPDLTPAAAASILRRTATAVGPRQPDNRNGWGLVNAYAAVSSVGEVGFIRGSVSRLDGTPVYWAHVALRELDGSSMARATVDGQGRYEIAVHPGVYGLTAEAFAFSPQTQRPVTVRKDETTRVDFVLEPSPSLGQFAGWVRARQGDRRVPIAARLELLDVPSEFAIQSNPDTGFSAQLPAGSYAVRIRQLGYRILTDTVTVSAGTVVTRAYELEPAPRILLVDGDAWLYRPAIDRFRQSLDRIGYPYAEWSVTDESAGPGVDGGPPRLEDLKRYDVVIWSHHTSSPGYVNAAEVLDKYLDTGGHLFLTGQDALCLDGGSDLGSDACNRQPQRYPYVEQRLHSRVVRDNSGSLTVIGTPGGLLSGLHIPLNGPDSADNQVAPDVLRTLDPLASTVVANYGAGGGAVLQVGPCTRERAIVFGFGFEGIAGARLRDEVLARVIEALWQAEPATSLRLRTAVDRQRADVGATVDFTVTLLNAGPMSSTVDVRLEGQTWPWSLWHAGFGEPLSGPLTVSGCRRADFGVQVQIPNVPRGKFEGVLVKATDRRSGAEASLALTATRLSPLLLVDGDFFYESEGRYVQALQKLALPFDHWELGLLQSLRHEPTAADLAQYPAVIWFTGYDWRPDGSLSLAGQRSLAGYLKGGGRLLFSSEDYLLIRATRPYTADRFFHSDYLGVANYGIDQGQAHQGPLRGANGSIFAGLENCRLPPRQPKDDLSDALVPRPEARPALVDGAGQTVGLEMELAPFKSLFLAFDLGLADSDCSSQIIRRAVDWFSPLHQSSLGLVGESDMLAPGEALALQLKLHNAGLERASGVAVHWSLPLSTTLTMTPTNWFFEPPNVLRWAGALAPGEWRSVTARLHLAEDLPANSRLWTTAAITDGHGLPLRRELALRANAPDLKRSQKTVAPRQTPPAAGGLASFTLILRNAGPLIAQSVAVTDWLPNGLQLVPQSVFADSGQASAAPDGRSVVWHTAVAPGRVAAMSYDVRILPSSGGRLRNRALVRDEFGNEVWLSAELAVPARLALPNLLRQISPSR